MVEVQLMHAGEEALIVLVPVAIVFLLDYRKRRRQKRLDAVGKTSPEDPAD